MCMADDGDTFAVHVTEDRTAAKPHTCVECGRTIRPGERYRHARGLFDGQWWTYRQCPHCVAAARWLMHVCRGWLYHAVLEDLRDHVNEAEETAVLPLILDLIGPAGHRWEGVAVETVEDLVATSTALYDAQAKRRTRRMLERRGAA